MDVLYGNPTWIELQDCMIKAIDQKLIDIGVKIYLKDDVYKGNVVKCDDCSDILQVRIDTTNNKMYVLHNCKSKSIHLDKPK